MIMYFDKDIADKIKKQADDRLLEVIEDFVTMTKDRSGGGYHGTCPCCGHTSNFKFTPKNNIFKCWACLDMAGNSAVTFLMKGKKMDYSEALKYLADKFHIVATDDRPAAVAEQKKGTFCQRMLKESGLTKADIEATTYTVGEQKSIFKSCPFRPGTIDDKGNIVKGDDVIIEYYDLDGYPVTYERKDSRRRGTGQRATYFRVRWQFPSAHLDKEGKSFKYKSPYGSGTPLYIPQWIRTAYVKKTPIPRLFIQEGEKKAEKACKHGIPSVAVSGIQNLGLNGALPEDLVRIIRDLQVKEVVFLMDSDWNDLSKEIKINVPVEKRPRCFFFAARNYKEYMRTLRNQDIYVEIYIGHTIAHHGDKGIDDLLTHTLKGNETAFIEDLNHAINEKKMLGRFVELFKITSWSDHKLEEIWGLDSPTSFARMHKEQLSQLPEFTYGRHKWKMDANGNLVLAQPFDDDEKFWDEMEIQTRNGDVRTEVTYSYVNARNFLQNRGFGRYRISDDGDYRFIQVDNPFVWNIQHTDARDYILSFAEMNCKKPVQEMLLKGGTQYLGPDKLSTLKFIEPKFLNPSRDCQYFYFRDNCWRVSHDRVEQVGYESVNHHVWRDRRRDIPATYLGKLILFSETSDGTYRYTLTAEGKQCHFLQFLINASNFTWRKRRAGEPIEQKDIDEDYQHLLSKLCAIGYMAMDAKDPNVTKAVIAMDGKEGAVGESNGRSGKSLVGELMRHITTIAYINGKKRDLLEDQFVWNDVSEKTRVVFIDDVLQNFNFEFLFPCITGDWTVNYKGGRRVTYPFGKSPKLYIPTNHAIKGSGSSYSDRQWLIAFSDYYHDTHKPADDFGQLFFSEWDYEQWNLTWNLVANCIQLYLQFGVVQAPMDRLEVRKIKQEITEGFIMWADEYFSDTTRLNTQIARRTLQDSFFESDPQQRKYVTPTEFKKRFKKYCEYRGYVFNPKMYDPLTGLPYKYDRDGKPILDDKSGGVEYFTVGTKQPVENTDNRISY